MFQTLKTIGSCNIGEDPFLFVAIAAGASMGFIAVVFYLKIPSGLMKFCNHKHVPIQPYLKEPQTKQHKVDGYPYHGWPSYYKPNQLIKI